MTLFSDRHLPTVLFLLVLAGIAVQVARRVWGMG